MTIDEIADALRVSRKDHLRTRLERLDDEKLVLHHPKSGRYHLTHLGVRAVEQSGIAQPA